MEYLFILLAFIFAFIGLWGAILPIIPGPPLTFAALLMLLMCNTHDITMAQLIIAGVLAVVITILDYVAPIWFTKKTGGSKGGTWGATIGLVIGLFAGPIGVVAGPFLGAFIGELLVKTSVERAFGVACMTFLAFMLTTGIKLIYGIAVFVMICIKVFGIVTA